MNQKTNKPAAGKKKKRGFRIVWILLALLVIGAGAYYAMTVRNAAPVSRALSDYREKCALLYQQVTDEKVLEKLGDSPAGDQINQVIFLSVSDGQSRAHVFTGTGTTVDQAWEKAVKKSEELFADEESGYQALWVKADAIRESETVTYKKLQKALEESREDFFRMGVSLDPGYNVALLEAELNGCKIYDYEDNRIDLKNLNRYLSREGRKEATGLPEFCRVFRTRGWLCDENNQVITLGYNGTKHGRRMIKPLTSEQVKSLINSAADYLLSQSKEDGSFIYGYYPRFDNEIDGYNILRHSGTIWLLTCHQRVQPSKENVDVIHNGLDYLMSQIVETDGETAYVLEEDSQEFKLGGNGLAILTFTEYMDVFPSHRYEDICVKLGNGILKLQDQQTGEYTHVLNRDLTVKEKMRTVYYDGEATFALCRLYAMTGDQKWLDAAKLAISHFIANDYAQYIDQWVSYSLNEITKYVDDPAYYTLALQNFQENVEGLHKETAAPTYMELVCNTYECYERMVERGITVPYLEEFSLEELLETIEFRTQRILDHYFFPEYAMYMEKPSRILGAFFFRYDGFRTRIDDIQHCIGGLYLYAKNYDSMVENGLLEED